MQFLNFKNSFRSFIKILPYRELNTMKAWQILKFGNVDNLELSSTVNIPILTDPNDVLVKIHAASVNPIDVRMLEGYGDILFDAIKTLKDLSSSSKSFPFGVERDTIVNMLTRVKKNSSSKSFPLIFGRDFSGTIVHVGKRVNDFKCEDEVWGVMPIISPVANGSHAEYVSVPSSCISMKPGSLTHIQAASLPYAALTAWSSLCTFGGLTEKSTYGKRILVIGASGGVGTFAVQLLKMWGAHVTATCSADAAEMLLKLGADQVLDYHSPEFKHALKDLKGLDIIFDNVGGDYPSLTLNLLKTWRNCKYITVVSPLLKNMDENGLVIGTCKSAMQAACDSAMSLKDGRSYIWAFFIPNGQALKSIAELVENNKVIPVIDEVFKFEDLPQAYEKVLQGHARGKTVIDFSESNGNEQMPT